MNKDQAGGIVERAIYGFVVFLAMKFGARYGITAEDAAWIAGGAVTLAGGAYAWFHNRPVSMLNRAGAAMPDNTKLVIAPTEDASHAERKEAAQLAKDTGDKIVLGGAVR